MSAPPARRRLRPASCAALLAVLALLFAALPAPTGALAASVEGGNSFNELSQKAQQEEPSTTETTSTAKTGEAETRNSSKTLLIGIGAAGLLLLVIAFVIVRDARRVAPAGAEEIGDGRRGRDAANRQRNRRAKAKAARQQRKKNR